MPENKINYGVCKLYYALVTDTGTALTYGTPIALPGSVNFSAAAKGEETEFEADNIVYFRSNGNEGYDITLETANVPDSFLTSVFGMTADTKKVIFENTGDTVQKVALLGQFDGDVHSKRWAFYNCTPSRYDWASETSRKKNPKTISMKFAADPDYDGNVKSSTTAETDSATYAAWFTAVYTKTAEAG